MKIYRHLILLVTMLCCICSSWADIPQDYYKNVNGKKKAELKSAFRNVIKTATVLDYGGGAGKTWSGFYVTDRYNGNQVRDRYSYEVFYFPSGSSAQNTSAANGMNIEHSFPKSWWGGTENQAYKDLFNLMPCEKNINSAKSNYAMGVVSNVRTNNGCTKVGTGSAGSKSCNLWEPADEWKGDFARNYFYMVTTYSNLTWKGEGLNMLQNDEWPTLQPWAYQLFLKWNRQDPVDAIEKERNEAVYGIQGNRNPFIDFPNLAEYIWGDSTDVAFNLSTASTDIPDDEYDFTAYPAAEIVSSIYSKRFDASWSKYQDGCEYTLDVYEKDSNGRKTSLNGYPVTTSGNTYRVTGVNTETTYYYKVYVYNGTQVVAQSNEVRVDFPALTPVFSVSPGRITFATTPGVASEAVAVTVNMYATAEKKFTAVVQDPYEVSDDPDADDEDWSKMITLIGSSTGTSFYVRLSAQDEGEYTGVMTLSTKGVDDCVVALLGSVDEQKPFFEDFETGAKGGYAAAEVKCAAATWWMSDALLGKDANNNIATSLRIKSTGVVEMRNDKTGGCDSLWFYAGNYNNDSGATLTVSYSLDSGQTWTELTTLQTFEGWKRYGFAIQQPGNIRLQFRGGGTSGKRLNIDDIQMSNYDEETGFSGPTPNPSRNGGEVYDLSGRRVTAPHKPGIYIRNGKKIFVR